MVDTAGTRKGGRGTYNMRVLRTTGTGLDWDTVGPLHVLVLQPYYRVETNGPNIGALVRQDGQRLQKTMAELAELIRKPAARLPPEFLPLHLVLVPELAVPLDTVRILFRALAEQPSDANALLCFGIERLGLIEYLDMIREFEVDKCAVREEERDLQASIAEAEAWVNCIAIAWRGAEAGLQVLFQRKITPSAPEVDSLCAGRLVRVLDVNKECLAFSNCADLLDSPAPQGAHGETVADFLLRQRREGHCPSLSALIHLQFNPKPAHGLANSAAHELLARHPQDPNEDLHQMLILQANAADECEEHGNYGRAGAMCARRYRGNTVPACCRVQGDTYTQYTLRPHRASAFLLEVRLPRHITGGEDPTAVRPVVKGRWRRIDADGGGLNLTDERSAVPDALRFAGWRAFPRSLGAHHRLFPTGHANADKLNQHVGDSYTDLRRRFWGKRGAFLSAWAHDVFRLRAPTGQEPGTRSAARAHFDEWDPDRWDEAKIEGLRALTRGLAVVHSGLELAAKETSAPQASALELTAGKARLHCRDVTGECWDTVRSRVAEDAERVAATCGDVYVVNGECDQGTPTRLDIAGLRAGNFGTSVPTDETDANDISRPTVVLVPVSSLLSQVLSDKSLTIEGMRDKVAAVLGARVAGGE
jgi:hypothetical protein